MDILSENISVLLASPIIHIDSPDYSILLELGEKRLINPKEKIIDIGDTIESIS